MYNVVMWLLSEVQGRNYVFYRLDELFSMWRLWRYRHSWEYKFVEFPLNREYQKPFSNSTLKHPPTVIVIMKLNFAVTIAVFASTVLSLVHRNPRGNSTNALEKRNVQTDNWAFVTVIASMFMNSCPICLSENSKAPLEKSPGPRLRSLRRDTLNLKWFSFRCPNNQHSHYDPGNCCIDLGRYRWL